jgi:hypothetical protein
MTCTLQNTSQISIKGTQYDIKHFILNRNRWNHKQEDSHDKTIAVQTKRACIEAKAEKTTLTTWWNLNKASQP